MNDYKKNIKFFKLQKSNFFKKDNNLLFMIVKLKLILLKIGLKIKNENKKFN